MTKKRPIALAIAFLICLGSGFNSFAAGTTGKPRTYEMSVVGTPCAHDKELTLQQMIDSGNISQTFVPRDLHFRESPAVYRSIRATSVYGFPVKDQKFSFLNLTCGLSCQHTVASECQISDIEGTNWLVIRWAVGGTLAYLDATDFEPASQPVSPP